MTALPRLFLAAILVLLCQACGTVVSLVRDQGIYGGISVDSRAITTSMTREDRPLIEGAFGSGLAEVLPLLLMDAPLCLVADTALLPITCSVRYVHGPEASSDAPPKTR